MSRAANAEVPHLENRTMGRPVRGLIALLFLLPPLWAPAAETPRSPEFARHLEALKPTVPEGFAVVVEDPFVVIAEGSPEEAKLFAERTVRWAVTRLQLDYFEKPPPEIYDIWLFKGAESYEKNTQAIFHEKPISPYGYFSPAHHALIMNIATGGGTLVHEIVHAFIASNFPECPTWFNEGLASLYEQCGDADGHIHGCTNWRLPGLQKAIRAGEVRSFEKLTAMTATEFYGDKAAAYSQSRYLCYYLQEKGLLVKFYKEFHANVKSDPTGYPTLKKVLGEEDMDAFKTKWEAEVLKLTFP
jgi:hypothetical protein